MFIINLYNSKLINLFIFIKLYIIFKLTNQSKYPALYLYRKIK